MNRIIQNIKRFVTNNILSLEDTEEINKKRLTRVLHIAQMIEYHNRKTLPDYIRLLGRKFQSDYMTKALSHLDITRIPDLIPQVVWFPENTILNKEGLKVSDIKKKCANSYALNLSKDLVLPWPWRTQSIYECLATVGEIDFQGLWEQDPNHRIEYWLPFGIGWVQGGNHSIMTGIIKNQGTVVAREVYDLSEIFKYVKFDGNYFVRISDNTIISKPSEFEFAAIFEVGRFMHELGVTA